MIFLYISCISCQANQKFKNKFLFSDFFDDSSWTDRWKFTKLKNYTGIWSHHMTSNRSYIQMDKSNSFHGISAKFNSPLSFIGDQFIIQYEVASVLPTVTCSGAYIKLFGNKNFNQDMLSNETNYIIMFGPDQCGETNKVHFILNHWNPVLKKFEEKQMIYNPVANISISPKIFTLIIKSNNKIEIRINTKPSFFGSFFSDFQPPINPPHEIDDPTDMKPQDWDDNEYIIDEEHSKKPDDWDENQPEFIPDPDKLNPPSGWLINEPKMILDPSSVKPDEWDESIYGKWEPKMVPNPKCIGAPGCGPYEPPLIINPKFVGPWEPPMQRNLNYKGKWRPRKIVNPLYYEDKEPFKFANLTGIGFDLWTVDGGIQFTNIIVSDNINDVDMFNRENYPHFFENENSKDIIQNEGFIFKDKITDLLNSNKYKVKEEAEKEPFSLDLCKNLIISSFKEKPFATICLTAFIIVTPIFSAIYVC